MKTVSICDSWTFGGQSAHDASAFGHGLELEGASPSARVGCVDDAVLDILGCLVALPQCADWLDGRSKLQSQMASRCSCRNFHGAICVVNSSAPCQNESRLCPGAFFLNATTTNRSKVHILPYGSKCASYIHTLWSHAFPNLHDGIQTCDMV